MEYKDTNFQQLADIMTTFDPLKCVTPINADEEKECWLKSAQKGNFTNPSFCYNYEYLEQVASHYNEFEPHRRSQILDSIGPIDEVDYIVKDIFHLRFDDAATITELASSILLGNDGTTSRLSAYLFGRQSNGQALQAYKIANREIPPSYAKTKPRFTKKDRKALSKLELEASQIGCWFTVAMNIYKENWVIELSDDCSNIEINEKTSHISIPTNYKVNGLELLMFIERFIECYLRCNENSRHLFEDLIGKDSPLMPFVPILAKSNNELLYNGTAAMKDTIINGLKSSPSPITVIASDHANRGKDFAGVAQVILPFLDELYNEKTALELAWDITYGVKRGCTDTTKPYCFSHDFTHFCGHILSWDLAPVYTDFASLSLEELIALSAVAELKPKHYNLDVISEIKNRLLS